LVSPVTPDLLTLFSSEDQKLDVHLDMKNRHLFVVALGARLSQAGPAKQAVRAVALEGAIDTRV
jgi:hypothetical protein